MVLDFSIYYLSFCVLNFYIVKNIIQNRAIVKTIILTVLILFLLVSVPIIADIFYKNYLFIAYRSNSFIVFKDFLKQSLIITLLGIILFISYSVLKYALLSLTKNINPVKFSNTPFIKDALILITIWLLGIFFLNASRAPEGPIICWVFVASISVLIYLYATGWLIPSIKNNSQNFTSYIIWFAISMLPFLAVLFFIIQIGAPGVSPVIIALLNVAVQLLVVAPLAWFIYNRRLSKSAEIKGLKTALGTSAASLDMLRSQINPHFLFNALNTLYGTALQEDAVRTGEGIQKLGDMMRFMLQENMQETISITREIDYLQNYISMQKLRTQTSPNIVIQAEIDEQLSDLRIVPMLLIPFIENAFKHGISLREASYIKIVLYTAGNTLYFDVQNTIHARPENDPEKYNNGIGLENVKQRLQLLYPGKHELTIRETAKEFFIHLTLSL
ncbi:MAG: sensor histidine kinase [Sphingobacteriaceae bacterium]|nr:MAG: sensor histidine kinase [Sphingobacteriaceae bacterium]